MQKVFFFNKAINIKVAIALALQCEELMTEILKRFLGKPLQYNSGSNNKKGCLN